MLTTVSGNAGRSGLSNLPMPADGAHSHGVEGLRRYQCARTSEGRLALAWDADSASTRRVSGPVQFVIKLMSFWRLSRSEVTNLLGFGEGDARYMADLLDGTQPLLGRDAKDRIAYLFRIRALLSSLFRDIDVENQWLRESHAPLDGRRPLDLMRGSMQDLLLAKEYTETLAGR